MKKQIKLHRFPGSGTFTSLLILLILLASGCSGNAAPSLDTSGQAWVEYPYEGDILPMGPVVIVVYAADPVGISYIHVKVNGSSLEAIPNPPRMTSDGSARLVRVDQAWNPPGEGEYLVEAVGVNNAGAGSGSGSTRFCIVTCNPVVTDTPTPAPAEPFTPTATPALPVITLPPLSPTPTMTLTPPPPPANVTVNFFAEPPYVNAGNCSTLRWVVTGTDKVYLNGSLVPATSNEQRCPCETETHTLRVTAPDGTSQDFYARIDVYGSCYVPPPTTEAPPTDTTGPSINSFSTFWEGCSIYGQASFSDPSGVAYAEFWYNLDDGGWSSISMSNYGGSWQSQSGITTGGFAGSVKYKFHAVDNYGNESWSGVETYNFSYCGG